MDKLPEPVFEKDKIFSRKLLGVDSYLTSVKKNRLPLFLFFSTASIFRYFREITYYTHNSPYFAVVIVPTFLFSSWQLAVFLTNDKFAEAAKANNKEEERYIQRYRELFLEAKRNNIVIPDHLIK